MCAGSMRNEAGRTQRTQVLFVGEDFTIAADKQRDWETAGGVQPVAQQMLLGRGLQIGICIVSHTIGISPTIMKSIETLLVLQLRGEDRRAIQNLLGTTPLQTEKITMLQRGELVALVPSWPRPVYARFEPLALPRELTEAEREATAKAFLDTVTAVKAVSPPQGRQAQDASHENENDGGVEVGPTLTSKQVSILVLAGTARPEPLTKLYKRFGLKRAIGLKLVTDLEVKGLICRHTFSTGKRGGRLTLLEATRGGWDVLKRHGISQPDPVTGGGWEHNVGAALVGDTGTRKGMKVSYEVDLLGARVDVEWRAATGRRTFYNIGVSTPVREAQNALKIISLPVMADNGFIFVARDSAFAKKFKACLKARDPNGTAHKDIEIKLIADFLDI